MSTSAQPCEREFRLLYERTSATVYGYVRRRCEEADCDDVIAEVFLVAWRRWADLPADPVPWLLGVARRTLAHHWRSRQRRQRLAVEIEGMRQLAATDGATQAVERVSMLQALAGLSADDREILFLTGWDGLDSAEAAQVLEISPAAARARLSRARRRLVARFDSPSNHGAAPTAAATEGN